MYSSYVVFVQVDPYPELRKPTINCGAKRVSAQGSHHCLKESHNPASGAITCRRQWDNCSDALSSFLLIVVVETLAGISLEHKGGGYGGVTLA